MAHDGKSSNTVAFCFLVIDSVYSQIVIFFQATQVKYTTDDFDQRILYEYLAEASVVFPKVFPVVWVAIL